MRPIVSTFFILFLPCMLWAQERAITDSIPYEGNNSETRFKARQLILPASLIAVGSWGVCNGFLQSVNHSVQDGMTNLRGDHYFHADDYIQYLPVVSYVGLGLVGVKAKHSFKERLIVTATSYLTMGILVNGTKYLVDEKRPDSSAQNSFPSGHTATAFMGAELVRSEYGTGYGIGAYLVAGGVAFLRLYNNRHWLNDVLAGAGFGILSARIGYWLLPINKRLFKLDKKDTAIVSAAPFYYPAEHVIGGALAVRF
ncbi:phosphatase PAP2 family protein [Parabacteroides sp.]